LDHTLETRIGSLLRERGSTLALAESCTGGLVSDRVTNVPGSSSYFHGGIVAYAYQAKVDLLGVSWSTLESHGAVSQAVVLEMAQGACNSLKSDIGVSISGIAGPDGGTESKPVGTVWIALVAADETRAREFHFTGEREQIKAASAEAALQLLLDYLQGNG
jgi:nicotinamide-nucleotide amidase